MSNLKTRHDYLFYIAKVENDNKRFFAVEIIDDKPVIVGDLPVREALETMVTPMIIPNWAAIQTARDAISEALSSGRGNDAITTACLLQAQHSLKAEQPE